MYSHLTEALAQQRVTDLRRAAAAQAQARSAAGAAEGLATGRTLARRAGRLIRPLRSRRYREIELVWPDGVCSVVPARSDDRPQPMANSRR
jgi:hypothetical protein